MAYTDKQSGRRYDHVCDGCAACCLYFQVDVTEADVRREPRIALVMVKHGPSNPYKPCSTVGMLGHPAYTDPPTADAGSGCPLLTECGECSVEATKPDVCRRFNAGSAMCQWARGLSGLPPLGTSWLD